MPLEQRCSVHSACTLAPGGSPGLGPRTCHGPLCTVLTDDRIPTLRNQSSNRRCICRSLPPRRNPIQGMGGLACNRRRAQLRIVHSLRNTFPRSCKLPSLSSQCLPLPRKLHQRLRHTILAQRKQIFPDTRGWTSRRNCLLLPCTCHVNGMLA